MSQHPMTDKASTPHIGFYSCATVPSSFAAELETELNSCKKQLNDSIKKIENQAQRIQYLEGATNHACGTPLSIALRERDEARKERDALRDAVNALHDYVHGKRNDDKDISEILNGAMKI